jgi:hypothetical protein
MNLLLAFRSSNGGGHFVEGTVGTLVACVLLAQGWTSMPIFAVVAGSLLPPAGSDRAMGIWGGAAGVGGANRKEC